eukprot:3895130-Ditylum_brightwellii.AAC.1
MINPNRILLANNGLEFKMICKESMANGTDYMGYMETNLDTLYGSVTKQVYYRPEGTMSIIQGNLTAQVIEQESDWYG